MAGASGTHSVYVCTIHQNVKFMLEACKISELTRNSEHHLSTCQHCLSTMICNPPQTNCFFRDCSECSGPTDLENTLEDVFTDNAIGNITFKQWISTFRCELVTIVKSAEAFIESLLEKLLLLLCHLFTAMRQAMFLKEPKCNLQLGEFMVLCNFAANYSIILQDEAQDFHWNNAQATIHQFVIYFKKSDALNTQHENLVMTSDCLKHDSILVHTFQWHLMKFFGKHI
jgi:hypothetical protein